MTRRFPIFAIALVISGIAGSAACGGKVDDPAAGAATAPGTNAPQSTSSGDGCERSCDRLAECTTAAQERTSCVSACGRELTDESAARAFATCLEALSCADLERGLSMNYGPIGECYTLAHRR